MNKFEELLRSPGPVLLDGAMGTMLMDAGLEQGDPPEGWNVIHPERVRAVHRGYIQSGSRLILTNSFGGTRFRLELHNLQDRVRELNQAAAQIARAEADAAPHTVVVAGSMGPSGQLMEPMGTLTYEGAKAAFAEQAAALAAGGADVLWIETMSDLHEVKAAIDGARAVSDLPVVATMTFDTHGRTMMGVKPEQAVEFLQGFNLSAIGGNCGNGPGEIEAVINAMRAAGPEVPLVAKANAGLPYWEGGELKYDGTPEVMGNYACRVHKLGAKFIGGCCGNTPDHIKSMSAALKEKVMQ
jgi:methionine synthase I (cobalamin-dependent)